MRVLVAPALAVLVAACGTQVQPDATPDAGPVAKLHELVAVSGTVHFHPLEILWRGGLLGELVGPGPAPSLAGAQIRVENSTDALLRRPPLATSTLAGDGAFSFPQVDVVNVSIALVASVKDPAGKVMESGYGLHRYTPGEARPAGFPDKPVYVLTVDLEKKLAGAVGISTDDLELDGFVLGQVVDKEGKAIAGVKVAKMVVGAGGLVPKALENTADKHIIDYLNTDLTATVNGQTSASGAFLLFPGASISEYSALKDGVTFQIHLSGARPGTAMSLFIEAK